MILDSNSERPEINYPCNWEYKVIGRDVEKMLAAIENAALGLEYDVTPSNISKKGNYYSLKFVLSVPNQTVRDLVFEKLDNHNDVVYVL